MPRLSIIFPCYNEAGNLDEIIRRTEAAIGDRHVEVILVDNGSTDGTAQLLEQILPRIPVGRFRSVRVPVNRGYGHGIFDGISAATGDVICWTHADLQVEPTDVIATYDAYVARPDWTSCVMKGRRTGRSPFDVAFTVAMGWVTMVLLGVRLSDINAQPKMFPRAFLQNLPDPPADFSLDLYMLYQARTGGFGILEHPLPFGRRVRGDAKGGGTLAGKIKVIRQTLTYMMRFRQERRKG